MTSIIDISELRKKTERIKKAVAVIEKLIHAEGGRAAAPASVSANRANQPK